MARQTKLFIQTLKELSVLLQRLKDEPKVDSVVITSSGLHFCTGIDLVPLVVENTGDRWKAVQDTTNCIQ